MMPLFGATWGTPADLTGQSNKENASTNNPGNILLQQMTQRATKAGKNALLAPLFASHFA